MSASVLTSSSVPCPLCDSTDTKRLAGAYALYKCLQCGERFEPDEDDLDSDRPEKVRTKFKENRYTEE